MTTTLLQIEKWHPCEWGWKKLLNHLGKTEADEEELSIKTILESNGIKDAVWALRAVNGKDGIDIYTIPTAIKDIMKIQTGLGTNVSMTTTTIKPTTKLHTGIS